MECTHPRFGIHSFPSLQTPSKSDLRAQLIRCLMGADLARNWLRQSLDDLDRGVPINQERVGRHVTQLTSSLEPLLVGMQLVSLRFKFLGEMSAAFYLWELGCAIVLTVNYRGESRDRILSNRSPRPLLILRFFRWAYFYHKAQCAHVPGQMM